MRGLSLRSTPSSPHTFSVETHSTEDPDVSLPWRLRNQNQILIWVLSRDLPTNLPLEFSRWGLDHSNWIAYRTSDWDHTLMNLGSNCRGWRGHIFPSPCEELAQTPKTPPRLIQWFIVFRKTTITVWNPKQEIYRCVHSKEKVLWGLLQGHCMLIVKKIMGNMGQRDIERGNGQGSPTRSWNMERSRCHGYS